MDLCVCCFFYGSLNGWGIGGIFCWGVGLGVCMKVK